MKIIRPKQFKRFDRMSPILLAHFDCVLDLLMMKYEIPMNGDYRPDEGVHGQGLAVHFILKSPLTFYDQTVKVLNACNEHFRERNNQMRFRLGAYPEEKRPFFHLDILPERLFWIARNKRNGEGQKIPDTRSYKYYRDMMMFLNGIDEGV